MEEEKKLYPLIFSPFEGDSGEMVQIADLGYEDSAVRNGWLAADTISEIMEMYMDRVVGEGVFDTYGRQFPLSVRTLKVDGRLPLRVSPDNATASERFDFLGKSRFWYILSSESDSSVGVGFKREINAGVLYESCLDSSVEKYLNLLPARQGDSFLISPGTVFYAKGKLTILEVAQCSPLDFNLCEWGKPRKGDDFEESLCLSEALDFINYGKHPLRSPATKDEGPAIVLAKSDEFDISLLSLTDPLKINSGDGGSFSLYSCLSGSASIQARTTEDGKAENYVFNEGETVLVPAEVDEFLVVPLKKGTVLIEALSPALSSSEQM